MKLQCSGQDNTYVMESHLALNYSVLLFVFLHVVCGSLSTFDGQLVKVVDNCTPGEDSTCPRGKCCVKEGLAYIPEYTGPQPAYQISCKPYRQQGEFCYHSHVHTNTHEVCPCASTLECTSNGLFGHCQ